MTARGNGTRSPGGKAPGKAPGMDARTRDTFLDMLREPVSVQKGGRTEQMQLWQATSRKQIETALKGNSIALRDVLNSYRQAAADQAAEVQEDCELWTTFKEHQERLIAAARAAGRPIDDILPHPEDIVINWSQGIRIIGPSHPDELRRWQGVLRLRDALYVQEALEERLHDGPEREPSADAPLTLAMVLNAKLPPSLRLSRAGEANRMHRLYGQNKRSLLKEAKAAWHAAGKPLPRGWRYKHGEKILAAISTLLGYLPQLSASVTDPREQEDLCAEIAYEVMIALHGRAAVEARLRGQRQS